MINEIITMITRRKQCEKHASEYLAQKANVREKARTINYDQWERLYRPITNGGWHKDFHPYHALSARDKALFDLAQKEKRLWTEVVEGDSFNVIPGIACVNRVAFYITEKPCRLNLTVEDPLDIQPLRVTSADAKQLLLGLDQNDYPFDVIWSDKTLYLDVSTVDDHRQQVEHLCKKYNRRISDAIELSWY